MEEPVQKVRETTTQAGNTTQRTQEVIEPRIEMAHRQNTAARIIWYIGGVILVLLAFRFVLALLGANPASGFASFIYNTSYPLVAPFFGLFGYNLQKGVARFELFTLVAMAVYAIVAAGLARLVTINRD